jgi:dihydrofolate reductase
MKLKRQEGKDMVVYGGASFDSSLIKLGLIDEFLLFINPVAIGNGMTIFKDLNVILEDGNSWKTTMVNCFKWR